MAYFNPLITHIANASVVDAHPRRSINWTLYIIVFALGYAASHISF